jgi:hypothetical protein
MRESLGQATDNKSTNMRQRCSVNFDSATSFNKNREELSVSPAKSRANLGIIL